MKGPLKDEMEELRETMKEVLQNAQATRDMIAQEMV